MPSDIQYDTYQHYGTAAQRLAFTPSPPVLAGCQPIYIWYETDTGLSYVYTTAWHPFTSGGGSSAIDPFLLMGG